MKLKKVSKFFIIIFMIVTLHTISFADVGSFDRYDSGSSGFGSSSSGFGSSSLDWDYGSNYGSGSTIDSFLLINLLLGNNFGRVFLLMIIIASVVGWKKHKHTEKARPRNRPYEDVNRSQNTTPIVDVSQSLIHAEQIKQIDPNFSEEKMLAWAKELFIKLQNAWTARDWEPMRPFETQNLFEQHKAQMQGYIDTNRINVMDRIAVNDARIYQFRQEGDRDILEIALKSTMKDYIIDATTKQVLEGNKLQDRVTVYKMTFERKSGVLTPEGTSKIKTTNCPNCGAPTQITSAGKCEYCGSVMTTGANTWVLSSLEPLRN